MSYFPTPFDFDEIMAILGEKIDGNPYMYSYGVVPTDAASFASPNFTWSDYRTQPTWTYITSGGGWMIYNTYYQNGVPIFRVDAEPVLSGLAATIPAAQIQTDWNATSGLGKVLNKPSLSTVATSGSYSDLTGRPALSMVATSGSYADLSSKPLARSQSMQTRSLNTAFQVSTTQDAMVNYSVSIAATLSLVTGQSGTASLQICSTSGGTYVEVARFTNGNTGALTVGLNLVQTVGGILSGMVPLGYYAKIVSSGTATTSYVMGQEILL